MGNLSFDPNRVEQGAESTVDMMLQILQQLLDECVIKYTERRDDVDVQAIIDKFVELHIRDQMFLHYLISIKDYFLPVNSDSFYLIKVPDKLQVISIEKCTQLIPDEHKTDAIICEFNKDSRIFYLNQEKNIFVPVYYDAAGKQENIDISFLESSVQLGQQEYVTKIRKIFNENNQILANNFLDRIQDFLIEYEAEGALVEYLFAYFAPENEETNWNMEYILDDNFERIQGLTGKFLTGLKIIKRPQSIQERYSESEFEVREFFLDMLMFFGLYQAQFNLHSSDPEKYSKPMIQLSAKGLAILSYLWAEKEKTELQPFIASSKADLEYAVRLMINTRPGARLTIVFLPAGKRTAINEGIGWNPGFAATHKIALQCVRSESGLDVILFDSINQDTYVMRVIALVQEAVGVSWQGKLSFYRPSMDLNYRQRDTYQCGIIALKDARMLIKEPNLLNEIKKHVVDTIEYQKRVELNYVRSRIFVFSPYNPSFFKTVQSKTQQECLMRQYPSEVINRKRKTLRELFTRKGLPYLNYFSDKYSRMVREYVMENQSDTQTIQKALYRFDAGKLTPERLDKLLFEQEDRVEKEHYSLSQRL